MEFFFEIVFQFLAEVLLQAFAELLLELGFHRLAKALKRPRSPALSTVGFALLGIVAGGISLLVFPTSHIHDPMFRKLNLVVAPLALGLVMMLIGQIRQKKGQDLVRLDQFGYAFLFAFAMAVVRYIWAD